MFPLHSLGIQSSDIGAWTKATSECSLRLVWSRCSYILFFDGVPIEYHSFFIRIMNIVVKETVYGLSISLFASPTIEVERKAHLD